jgi:hypothetical protein
VQENIRIGTNTPDAKLAVHGQFRIRTTDGDGNESRLFFNPGGAGDPAQLYLYNEAQSNTIYVTANGASYFNGGGVGIGTTGAICKLQVGSNTFAGGNGAYSDARIGAMVNGSLTSYVYASTYNDATYPDYGFIFIHGGSTSAYNVWSISPDGPAKGSGLHFLYGYNASNIHTATPKVSLIGSSGNVGIGVSSPVARLDVLGTGDSSGFAALTLRAGNSSDNFSSNQIRLGYSGTSDYSHTIKTRHHSNNYLNAIDFYVWKYATDSAGTIGTQHVMTLTQGIDGVNGNGRVGIGTTYPSYKLDVSGDIRATGDVIAYSDARVKDNVETVKDALQTVTLLRGVTYTRKDNEDKSRKVGVIAQEVLPILPEVVQKDTNGNYSVAYGNIVGVLIEALKELKAEIDELKNK